MVVIKAVLAAAEILFIIYPAVCLYYLLITPTQGISPTSTIFDRETEVKKI